VAHIVNEAARSDPDDVLSYIFSNLILCYGVGNYVMDLQSML